MIGIPRKLTRSFVKPLKHVFEQLDGGVGCRAAFGSGGICGGATGCRGELTGAFPQAASRSVSATQIVLQGLACEVFGIEGLLNPMGALGLRQTG